MKHNNGIFLLARTFKSVLSQQSKVKVNPHHYNNKKKQDIQDPVLVCLDLESYDKAAELLNLVNAWSCYSNGPVGNWQGGKVLVAICRQLIAGDLFASVCLARPGYSVLGKKPGD